MEVMLIIGSILNQSNILVLMYVILLQVIQLLDDENLRSRKFLHPSSYSKVTKECEQRMIADHLQFLHGECREMVQKEKRKGTLSHW